MGWRSRLTTALRSEASFDHSIGPNHKFLSKVLYYKSLKPFATGSSGNIFW